MVGRYPEARVEFEKINNLDLPYEFPSANINMAQSYLLENNRTEASLNFGFIQTEEDLAMALSDIRQYSALLKTQTERYNQLQEYASFLRKTQLDMHPDFDSSRVNFLYYKNMTEYFNHTGQFDSTWVWSQDAMVLSLKECQLLPEDTEPSHPSYESLIYSAINTSHSSIFIHYNKPEKLVETLNQSRIAIKIAGEHLYGSSSNLKINIGNLYMLLGYPDKAIESYRAAKQNEFFIDPNFYDYLLKDWRDMYRAGIKLRGLGKVAAEFFPNNFPFSEEDLKAIGR